MKNSTERLVTIVVGIAVLFFAHQFWFGSGIFNGWFSPNVESGKLGAGTADFFSQFLEIVLTIVSTIGTVAIAIGFKLIRRISDAIHGTATEFARKPPGQSQMDQGDVRVVVKTESTKKHINKQQQADYTRVLLQAVVEGDKGLVVAMAERINGTKFLTATKETKVTPSGFPTQGGAK